MLQIGTIRYRAPLVLATAILILIGISTSYFGPVHSQDRGDGDVQIIENSFAVNDVVRSLPIVASDVIYNQQDQRLYVSSPSSGGAIGNAVTRIDPISGQLISSIPVGSEPNKLALSSDGQTMYTILDGASAIRRIDLTTQTAGPEFPIGSDNFYGYFGAFDIAVVPGNPNRLALARYYPGVSPPGAGVAIYDNGVRLPLTGQGHSAGANFLAFAGPSVLYGGGYYDGLRTMTVTDSGVTDSGTNTSFPVARLKIQNGLIYTSNGQVIDPQTRTLLGTFFGANASNAFAADAGRAFYAIRENSSITIKAYDSATYVLTGTLPLTSVNADPVSMVRYGSNGLALVTSDGRLHLIQTSLIPTTDPLPTPSPTPTTSPTPTPTPYTAFVQQMNLPAKDLAFNPATNRLLASIPSDFGPNGNSVGTIEPMAAQLESTTFVGSEPNKMALSNDGRVLWVGLDGAGSVGRFDTVTNTAGVQFSLGTTFSNLSTAQDIAVLPGSADTVAVNASSTGVGLFDNGVRRGSLVNASGTVRFRSSNELIVGGSPISRYSVTSNGLSLLGNATGSYGDFQVADSGKLYFVNGRVLDPAVNRLAGTFNLGGQASAVAVDQASRRVFFLTNSYPTQIRAFDMDSYLPIGSFAVQTFSYSISSLVRWGIDGLAWRDDTGKVYIARSKLVDPRSTAPSPTPTISPTPTVSPTPPITFVRALDLPVGDIVFSSATNQLHASVPGLAGPGLGNSIVRIDPGSGEVRNATFIGSDPGRLAISSDGGTAYCKLDGAGDAVRRFSLATDTAGLQFVGPQSQADMRVMPGNPQSVAFASGIGGGGVSVWDNGIKRGNSSNGNAYGIYTLDFTDASTIYGYDNYSSGFELIKFQVTPSGIVPTFIGNNWISGYGVQITASDGIIYASSGRVFNPALNAVVGTFNQSSGVMAVDRPANRIYFYSGSELTAYDLTTFLRVGRVPLQLNGNPTRIVRWGTNGLAIRTNNGSYGSNDGRLYLVQSALVSPSEPIPSGLQLGSSIYNISEGSGDLQVSVLRTGDLSGTATVTYQTENGTAIAGSDYVAATGSVVFAPGESSKTINIQILNDNVFETNESFALSLTRTVGDNTIIVSPKSATISIFDNDSRPGIQGSNRRVSEFASTVLIPVTLSNPSSETVTLNYNTANGTAQAGSDYVATSGVITFAPLETSKLIPVTIINDGVAEGDETFSLVMTNAVNGNIQSANPVITITDSPGFTISGRVTTPGGQGLRNALVTLVDSNGVRLTAATSSFGAYQFDAVLGGQTVTLSVASKRYRFAPRVVAISTSLSNVDFVGLE